MDALDIIACIFSGLLLIGIILILFTVIPDAYNEYKSYNIMVDECNANPDICFCDRGSCSIKSSCSYNRINDGPTTGGCNYTRICDIVKKANWKEGIWEYDCK